MSATAFPSISSLLNPPTSSCEEIHSRAETCPKQERRSPGPATSLLSISPALPGTPRLSYREPFEPGFCTLSSPLSLSTIIDPNSPGTAQSDLRRPSDSSIDNAYTNHQEPPNADFDSGPLGMFSRSVDSTSAPRNPPHLNPGPQFPSAASRSAQIDSLVKICTTAALKFYHSLLPAPAVCVSVQQGHAQSPDMDNGLPFPITTEYCPHPTPQTALLCAEALWVIRANDAKLSLTQVLHLIGHATGGGGADATSHSTQQLMFQSHHAARMAELWGLAAELSRTRSRGALGVRLDPMDFPLRCCTAAREFCEKLGDEQGMRSVDHVLHGLRLGG